MLVLCRAYVGSMLVPWWLYVGPMLRHVEPCWPMLGLCWGMLGLCWAHVGPMLRHLGPCWAYVGVMLGLCWGIMGHVEPMLGPCWPMLGPSWAMLGPSLATEPISRPSQKRGKTHDSRAKMPPPPSPKLKLNSYCNCLPIMRANKNASAPSVRADFQGFRDSWYFNHFAFASGRFSCDARCHANLPTANPCFLQWSLAQAWSNKFCQVHYLFRSHHLAILQAALYPASHECGDEEQHRSGSFGSCCHHSAWSHHFCFVDQGSRRCHSECHERVQEGLAEPVRFSCCVSLLRLFEHVNL